MANYLLRKYISLLASKGDRQGQTREYHQLNGINEFRVPRLESKLQRAPDVEFLKSQRNKFNKRATGKGGNVLKFVHYIYDVFKYAGFVVLKKKFPFMPSVFKVCNHCKI